MTCVFRVMFDIAAELQDLGDVLGLGRQHARRVLDDVVEFEFEAGMLAVRTESFGLRLIRVEDGEHMADLAVGVACKLLYSADGNQKRGLNWRHFSILRPRCATAL